MSQSERVIRICVDSQDELKALTKMETLSSLARECNDSLIKFGPNNRVGLYWVLGHKRYTRQQR